LEAVVLKGHGFSRAYFEDKTPAALATEGRISASQTNPQGLKPRIVFLPLRHG
jgi:hypothetical protein